MAAKAARPLDAAAQRSTTEAGNEPVSPEKIFVNTSALTIDDMAFLESFAAGERKTFTELRDVFVRVVINEDGSPAAVGKRSKDDVGNILAAIFDALAEDANPKDAPKVETAK